MPTLTHIVCISFLPNIPCPIYISLCGISFSNFYEHSSFYRATAITKINGKTLTAICLTDVQLELSSDYLLFSSSLYPFKILYHFFLRLFLEHLYRLHLEFGPSFHHYIYVYVYKGLRVWRFDWWRIQNTSIFSINAFKFSIDVNLCFFFSFLFTNNLAQQPKQQQKLKDEKRKRGKKLNTFTSKHLPALFNKYY